METMKKGRHLGLKGLIIAVIVLIVLFATLINWITDFMWFSDLGYVSVFLTKLLTQLKIGVPVFVVVTLLAYIYLKCLKKGYTKKVDSDEVLNNKALNLITWGLAVAFGGVTTYFSASNLWFQTLQFIKSTGFNIKDPLFNIDKSFYVFKLNFIEQLNELTIVLLVTFVIIAVVYYLILISMRTPKIFETVEEDVDDEYEYEDEEDDGPDIRRQYGPDANPFSEINDIVGKFAKGFKNGRMGGGRRKKKQLDNNNIKLMVNIAEKQLIVVSVLLS